MIRLLANPWAPLILGALLVGAIAAAIGGAYVKGRSDGRAIEIAERATIEEIARVSREEAIQASAQAIARIQVVNKTVHQRATHEVIEKRVYRDCVHTADGLRYINAALANRAESAGSSELPGADAPH